MAASQVPNTSASAPTPSPQEASASMPNKPLFFFLLAYFFFSFSACEHNVWLPTEERKEPHDASSLEKRVEPFFESDSETTLQERESEFLPENPSEPTPEPTCVLSCAEPFLGVRGKRFDVEGPPDQQLLGLPAFIARNQQGDYFIAEEPHLSHIKKYTKEKGLFVFAGTTGTEQEGIRDGPAHQARFFWPVSLAIDSKGNLFVGEGSNRVRKITPQGEVSTFVGNGKPESKDGIGQEAQVNGFNLTIDQQDNLYLSDGLVNRIRKITPQGEVTTIAGTGESGDRDGKANEATFYYPRALVVDKHGNLYISDTGNYKIRKLTPDGQVSTFSGSGTEGSKDGTKDQARFGFITGFAFHPDGDLYAMDHENGRIIRFDAQGTATTVAGTGKEGYRSAGSLLELEFHTPSSLLFDSPTTFLITERLPSTVRRVYLKNCPCLPPPSKP